MKISTTLLVFLLPHLIKSPLDIRHDVQIGSNLNDISLLKLILDSFDIIIYLYAPLMGITLSHGLIYFPVVLELLSSLNGKSDVLWLDAILLPTTLLPLSSLIGPSFQYSPKTKTFSKFIFQIDSVLAKTYRAVISINNKLSNYLLTKFFHRTITFVVRTLLQLNEVIRSYLLELISVTLLITTCYTISHTQLLLYPTVFLVSSSILTLNHYGLISSHYKDTFYHTLKQLMPILKLSSLPNTAMKAFFLVTSVLPKIINLLHDHSDTKLRKINLFIRIASSIPSFTFHLSFFILIMIMNILEEYMNKVHKKFKNHSLKSSLKILFQPKQLLKTCYEIPLTLIYKVYAFCVTTAPHLLLNIIKIISTFMSDIWTHLVFLFSNPPTQKVVFKTLSELKPEDFELSNKFIYSTQSINPKKISISHGFPLKQFEKLIEKYKVHVPTATGLDNLAESVKEKLHHSSIRNTQHVNTLLSELLNHIILLEGSRNIKEFIALSKSLLEECQYCAQRISYSVERLYLENIVTSLTTKINVAYKHYRENEFNSLTQKNPNDRSLEYMSEYTGSMKRFLIYFKKNLPNHFSWEDSVKYFIKEPLSYNNLYRLKLSDLYKMYSFSAFHHQLFQTISLSSTYIQSLPEQNSYTEDLHKQQFKLLAGYELGLLSSKELSQTLLNDVLDPITTFSGVSFVYKYYHESCNLENITGNIKSDKDSSGFIIGKRGIIQDLYQNRSALKEDHDQIVKLVSSMIDLPPEEQVTIKRLVGSYVYSHLEEEDKEEDKRRLFERNRIIIPMLLLFAAGIIVPKKDSNKFTPAVKQNTLSSLLTSLYNAIHTSCWLIAYPIKQFIYCHFNLLKELLYIPVKLLSEDSVNETHHPRNIGKAIIKCLKALQSNKIKTFLPMQCTTSKNIRASKSSWVHVCDFFGVESQLSHTNRTNKGP